MGGRGTGSGQRQLERHTGFRTRRWGSRTRKWDFRKRKWGSRMRMRGTTMRTWGSRKRTRALGHRIHTRAFSVEPAAPQHYGVPQDRSGMKAQALLVCDPGVSAANLTAGLCCSDPSPVSRLLGQVLPPYPILPCGRTPPPSTPHQPGQSRARGQPCPFVGLSPLRPESCAPQSMKVFPFSAPASGSPGNPGQDFCLCQSPPGTVKPGWGQRHAWLHGI